VYPITLGVLRKLLGCWKRQNRRAENVDHIKREGGALSRSYLLSPYLVDGIVDRNAKVPPLPLGSLQRGSLAQFIPKRGSQVAVIPFEVWSACEEYGAGIRR
jgi:hypothetical protein